MNKVVFLCSGGGGNLRFFHLAIEDGLLENFEIAGVISDRLCPALSYAEENSLNGFVVPFDGKQELVRVKLVDLKPDLIITNVHKIVQSNVLNSFEGKFINLHYSILPAFGGVVGKTALRRCIEYGSKITGVTVHHVNEELDRGSPLMQASFPISGADFNSILDLQFRIGCISLLNVANQMVDGSSIKGERFDVVRLKNSMVTFSPDAQIHTTLLEEEIWSRVKQASGRSEG